MDVRWRLTQRRQLHSQFRTLYFERQLSLYAKPCSFQTSRQEHRLRFTDERLLLRLTGITIILLFTTALSVSKKAQPCRHRNVLFLIAKKKGIAELYTFTKWEDDNPSVLIAAAQTLAKYHTLAIPHPASVDEYFSISEKLKKSIDVVLPQIDKLKEAKEYLSMEAILGFKDIVGTLEEKFERMA